MKYLIYILLFLSINCYSQQIGGTGHDNGYYVSTASLYLAADSTTVCTLADTWYPFKARLVDGHNVDFEFIKDAGIIYSRGQNKEFTFFGNAHAISDKAASVTFQLVIGVDTIMGGSSTQTFHNANEYEDFNLNRHITLDGSDGNDTLKFFMKSSQANTSITLKELNLTIIQVR